MNEFEHLPVEGVGVGVRQEQRRREIRRGTPGKVGGVVRKVLSRHCML